MAEPGGPKGALNKIVRHCERSAAISVVIETATSLRTRSDERNRFGAKCIDTLSLSGAE